MTRSCKPAFFKNKANTLMSLASSDRHATAVHKKLTWIILIFDLPPTTDFRGATSQSERNINYNNA